MNEAAIDILKIKLSFYEEKLELMHKIIDSHKIEVDGLMAMLARKDILLRNLGGN